MPLSRIRFPDLSWRIQFGSVRILLGMLIVAIKFMGICCRLAFASHEPEAKDDEGENCDGANHNTGDGTGAESRG